MTMCCATRLRLTRFLFSHTGDGVVAPFNSPTSAVDAAVIAQRALELPVRMDWRPAMTAPVQRELPGTTLIPGEQLAAEWQDDI
jgi:hypothetical protein